MLYKVCDSKCTSYRSEITFSKIGKNQHEKQIVQKSIWPTLPFLYSLTVPRYTAVLLLEINRLSPESLGMFVLSKIHPERKHEVDALTVIGSGGSYLDTVMETCTYL